MEFGEKIRGIVLNESAEGLTVTEFTDLTLKSIIALEMQYRHVL